jgi:hypothetical protein
VSIRPLEKENISRTTQVEHLSSELKKVDEEMQSFLGVDFTDVRQRKVNCCPKHEALRFVDQGTETCDVKVDNSCQTGGTAELLPVALPDPCNRTVQSEVSPAPIEVTKSSITSDAAVKKSISHIQTLYAIDRMTSDGRNVLYTSYNKSGPDVIGCSPLTDGNMKIHQYREWHHSHIEDMVWWKRIEQFVCATLDKVYTVDYRNQKLKVLSVMREKSSHVRAGANDKFCFLHRVSQDVMGKHSNEIGVFSDGFKLIRVFDATQHQFASFARSFCATDQNLVFVRTELEDNLQIIYVTIVDWFMNQLRRVRLGTCNGFIQVRTDDKARLLVLAGGILYVVTVDGDFRIIHLKDKSNCFAMLDNQRIAVSMGRCSMELVNY